MDRITVSEDMGCVHRVRMNPVIGSTADATSASRITAVIQSGIAPDREFE